MTNDPIGVCRHGQLTCEHDRCRSHCEECWSDDWSLWDALDRWADDGGAELGVRDPDDES